MIAYPAALWVFFLGLAVAGCVVGVRALPVVDRLVMAQKKPWACDFCMCFWGTLIWGAAGWHWYSRDLGQDGWFIMGPGYAVALLVLDRLNAAPPAPPPELLDGGE